MAKTFHKLKRSENIWGYLFIAPAIIVITIFWVIPSIGSLYYSFFDYNGIRNPVFVGLKNFIIYFTNESGINSLRVAGFYVIGTLPPAIFIGLVFAIIMNKKWFKKFTPLASIIYFIPIVMSYVGVSFVWKWLLQPMGGLINVTLQTFGIEGPNWLKDPILALLSILFISIWKNLGFFIILYLSALRQIPDAYLESADLDGVNEIQRFRFIIWPLVFPITIFLTILSFIDAFRVFDQVYALTAGGPNHATEIIAFYIWQVGFIQLRMGYASAIAAVILVIMIIITYLQWKYYSLKTEYMN